jgi:hypothetical protein
MRSNSWANSIIGYSWRKCRFVAILLFWIEFEFWIEITRISLKSLSISNIYFCRCFDDIHEFSFLFYFQMQIHNSSQKFVRRAQFLRSFNVQMRDKNKNFTYMTAKAVLLRNRLAFHSMPVTNVIYFRKFWQKYSAIENTFSKGKNDSIKEIAIWK